MIDCARTGATASSVIVSMENAAARRRRRRHRAAAGRETRRQECILGRLSIGRAGRFASDGEGEQGTGGPTTTRQAEGLGRAAGVGLVFALHVAGLRRAQGCSQRPTPLRARPDVAGASHPQLRSRVSLPQHARFHSPPPFSPSAIVAFTCSQPATSLSHRSSLKRSHVR